MASATPSPSASPGAGFEPDPDREAGTPGDSGPGGWHPPSLVPNAIRRLGPKTLQSRLTLGFASVVGLTILLVTVFVLNRLSDEFRSQEVDDLRARTDLVYAYVDQVNRQAAEGEAVVFASNTVNPKVVAALTDPDLSRFMADELAEADVDIVLGLPPVGSGDAVAMIPAPNGTFHVAVEAPSRQGLTKEVLQADALVQTSATGPFTYVALVRLSNPYTFRQTAMDNVTTVTAAVGVLALGIAVIVAAAMALRVTTPLRRLTEATRALAEGDLGSRIPRTDVRAGSSELAELAVQFNAMADQLEESVAIIRRDRDRSRDFLADVSHELRTPIAALLTFNELLTERVGSDPAARAEFLDNSRVQLERLDWLAQNLLELSKLDSGLVLLDLRPDDLRAAVESAVEQSRTAAKRRGIGLRLELASSPIRLRHDPQRIGQVVTNLVGNAIKFTPPGGSVAVRAAPADGGATIEVADTGVGIEPAELPRIFERFYRGTLANEARGSGSGLGLAIVRSIVDMHRGTVEVVSKPGVGTTFTVTLPSDPREAIPADGEVNPVVAALDRAPERTLESAADRAKMVDSSPSGAPSLNRESSG